KLAEEVRASLKLHVVGPAITGRRLSAPGVSLGVARSGQDVEAIWWSAVSLLKKWIRPPLGIVTAELLKPDEVKLIGASVTEPPPEPPQATSASKTNGMAIRMASPMRGRHCHSLDSAGAIPIHKACLLVAPASARVLA